MGVEFRLLGGVTALVDGRLVDVGPARQRCVLAMLLLDANHHVSTDQLVDRVWGDRGLPDNPRNAVQTYVSLLRRALATVEGVRIEHRTSGYVLTVAPEAVDLHRFRALVQRAHGARDDVLAGTLLAEAQQLWRGEAFGTLDNPYLGTVRVALQGERQEAQLDLVDNQLRRGQHAALLTTLARQVAERPLDERLAGQYVLALYRCGRQADALRHYQSIRAHLADELGLDPSAPLQLLHQQILTADPMLAVAKDGVRPANNTPSVTPRQLPMDVAGFAGRAPHLADLDRLLPDETPVVCVVSGPGGVGKTALVVHWGHRVTGRYPDGQLYVNLRGFGPDGHVSSVDAIRGFLAALGVSARRQPDGLDALAALFRSLVADRRMLLVLDNARDAEHVRPLLPGVSTCLVVVTSRNQLTGLVTAEGAHPVTLDPLPADDALALLSRRLGPDRVAREPLAVQEIITYCARLPLALAVVAARAAIHPRFPLTALATELRDRRDRLDALAGDDLNTDVRAVLSWSYHALGAGPARLFRLLGRHPGQDISVPAAASLAGVPVAEIRADLSELVRVHMADESTPGRYTCHDLLRIYAAERAMATDSDDERASADRRLLDHYLHAAYAAAIVLDPHRGTLQLPPPQPGVIVDEPAGHEQAMAWLGAEHHVLMAAMRHATDIGLDAHAHQLAWAVADFLNRRGYLHDLVAAQRIALTAATRLADPAEQARAHRNLARAEGMLGHTGDNREQLRLALELYRSIGDQVGEGHVYRSLSSTWDAEDQPAEAIEASRRAYDLFRACGQRGPEAEVLNAIGWFHTRLGEHEQAIVVCEQAIALLQDIVDRYGEAGAWDTIGYAHHNLGRHDQAVTSYHQSLAMCRELGDRGNEAFILTHLGDTHHAAGTGEDARRFWQQALAILTDLDHPDADELRDKLAMSDHS
ncbi:MAG TPA: BTAD domain-containing putative transcriptional regulator [Pseudonocardiaceae bacterium]|nr:BTAD domain-containing putative transcriptional regulator [Pseudonocardiaceae bacterium]